MRKNLGATLAIGFAGLFLAVPACSDDGSTSSGGEAGESTAGAGAMQSGGSKATGGSNATGGTSQTGNGGDPGSVGGDPSGSGGNPSGTGGEPLVAAGAAQGGESSGSGGEASASGGNPSGVGGEVSGTGGTPTGDGGEPSANGGAAGAGGGGPVVCTPITLGSFGQPEITNNFAEYAADLSPNIVGAGPDVFVISIQGPPYDGAETGTFDLTENGDDNYETCARCVLAFADTNGTRTWFYASEGTLFIDPASEQLDGTIQGTFTNLTLVEVTVNQDTYVSTPVPNGRCLTLASATIDVEPRCADPSCVPAEWVCLDSYYYDSDCDCGCGAQDQDCSSTTNATECEYCTECTNDFGLCQQNLVDPADTTQCL